APDGAAVGAGGAPPQAASRMAAALQPRKDRRRIARSLIGSSPFGWPWYQRGVVEIAARSGDRTVVGIALDPNPLSTPHRRHRVARGLGPGGELRKVSEEEH